MKRNIQKSIQDNIPDSDSNYSDSMRIEGVKSKKKIITKAPIKSSKKNKFPLKL